MTSAESSLPPVCVLGLGLIGGSVLRATADLTPAFGWSRSTETRQLARSVGFDVADDLTATLRRAGRDDALVVVAAPFAAFRDLLRAVADTAPKVRLTDVAGVKQPVADLVLDLAPEARYVGSHPMAGTEYSGWTAGTADLFQGAAWVTCLDEATPVENWTPVARLALALGARVVPADAGSHDAAVARVSHLPHLLALALAQVGAAGGPLSLALAAGSFRDGTRVAATRPALIRAMCESNRDALVDALDDALGLIGVARASLSSTGSLQKITDGGHAARTAFETRDEAMTEVTLDGDDLVDQLLSVGAAGGFITAITGPDADPQVSARYPDAD